MRSPNNRPLQERYAIYFDWGGVIRSLHDDEMFDDIADSCKVPRETVDKIWSQFGSQMTCGKMATEEFWERFAAIAGIDLPNCYNELFIRAYKKNSVLNDPVTDLIGRLRQAGYTTGLLSNTIRPHSDFFSANKEWSLYGAFEPIVISPEVQAKKGDAGHKIYLAAEGRVRQKTIFFADDSRRYALEVPDELNHRSDTPKRWIGIWTPVFESAATTIESALKKEGLDF